MKPQGPLSPSTPTTPKAPSLEPPSSDAANGAPRRGTLASAALYGPLDLAAEPWTDRELTERLRRNLD
jgi:hypothetical protein